MTPEEIHRHACQWPVDLFPVGGWVPSQGIASADVTVDQLERLLAYSGLLWLGKQETGTGVEYWYDGKEWHVKCWSDEHTTGPSLFEAVSAAVIQKGSEVVS